MAELEIAAEAQDYVLNRIEEMQAYLRIELGYDPERVTHVLKQLMLRWL